MVVRWSRNGRPVICSILPIRYTIVLRWMCRAVDARTGLNPFGTAFSVPLVLSPRSPARTWRATAPPFGGGGERSAGEVAVALSQDLGLIVANPATANIVIAVPQDKDVLPGLSDLTLKTAPVALVLADLMTLPGRSDAEADQLMETLARSNAAWKE